MPVFLWGIRLLGAFGAGLVQSAAGALTKKIAIIAMVVAAIAAFTVAFFAAILALVNSIVYALPNEFSAGLSLIVPSNAPVCFGAILTAHIIRWVYEWNVKVIQYRLS